LIQLHYQKKKPDLGSWQQQQIQQQKAQMTAASAQVQRQISMYDFLDLFYNFPWHIETQARAYDFLSGLGLVDIETHIQKPNIQLANSSTCLPCYDPCLITAVEMQTQPHVSISDLLCRDSISTRTLL